MTMTMLKLKQSYELVSMRFRDRSEIRDSSRNNTVVFRGTYRQCVRYAKRRGIWYS